MNISAADLIVQYAAKVLADRGLTKEAEYLRGVTLPGSDGGPYVNIGHRSRHKLNEIVIANHDLQYISDEALTAAVMPDDAQLVLVIQVPATINMHGHVKLEKVL